MSWSSCCGATGVAGLEGGPGHMAQISYSTGSRRCHRTVRDCSGIRASEQVSITMDMYTHVVHDTQRKAISHMERLLRRRGPTA
ncbi:hypothetical protein GCM10009716_22960 [Streptomyces sodiiphilus]|uniref:Integrase n=1 Tax=Streptomyces sodiiphilus TaxID=226217 RepID=A0ABP5AI43_9ACTN